MTEMTAEKFYEAGINVLAVADRDVDSAYVMMECISPLWGSRQGVEKSIRDTGAKFKWGI
ncbi:MAG: hypothetical protein Q4C61_10310 [Lachnospiraceae bacterium]|nr:hypothetical protein [Lachnospiraceae bacterium]